MKKLLVSLLAGVILFTGNLFADNKEDKAFISKNFPVASINKIAVSTSGGSVRVYGEAKHESVVEVFVLPGNGHKKNLTNEEIQKILDDNYDLNITVDGGVLNVSAKMKNGIKWNNNNGLSISFNFTVAPKTDIEMSTSGGSIQVHKITGSVDGKTSGGSIKISDLKNDNINLATSGGSIKAEDCSGNITLKTSGGSIKLESLDGTITAQTSGGSLDLEDLNGVVSAKTSGGSIKVDKMKGTLTTSTSGGSVHIKGMSGNLEASTSAGSMKVHMHEVKDYVKLNNNGSVSLELPKAKGYKIDIRGNKIKTNIAEFKGEFDSEKSMNGITGAGGPEITIRSSHRVEVEMK